jgi:hypothetical protein
MLCTLDDLKTRLGIGSEFDAMLTRIIDSFSAIAKTYTGRTLLAPAIDATEYYTGVGNFLQVMAYPVIAITSVKEASDYDYAAADALVANTDYRLVNAGLKGILYRLWTNWLDLPDCVQIVYRGGYCAAGVTPSTGEHALPADLREAAIEQVSFIFKRRDDIGLSSNSFQGGSINVFSSMDLLPMVKQILDSYRRLSL